MAKCCKKCACRRGSPERQDPYGWIFMLEGWELGNKFFCHESVPGHHQEVKDDRPRWRLCAGYLALKNKPEAWLRNIDDRPLGEAMAEFDAR